VKEAVGSRDIDVRRVERWHMTIPFRPVARSASGSTSGKKADMARRTRWYRVVHSCSPSVAAAWPWSSASVSSRLCANASRCPRTSLAPSRNWPQARASRTRRPRPASSSASTHAGNLDRPCSGAPGRLPRERTNGPRTGDARRSRAHLRSVPACLIVSVRPSRCFLFDLGVS